MATTKKNTDLDYTNQPQALTQEDVNNQDSRTRLWQSLGYSYGNQIKESNKSYDKAISQNDNAMLARGMGRSSYANQTRANLYDDKLNAENNIRSAWIADYQSRIGELEQQEKEEEWRQKEFDYKVSQDEQTQQNWQTQFDYQSERDKISDAFQEKQWQAQQDQWREEFDYSKMTNDQKIAFEVISAAAQKGGSVSDDILKRAGISRQDYNAMKKSASRGGGGGGKKTTDEENPGTNPNATTSITSWLNGLYGNETENPVYDLYGLARSTATQQFNKLGQSAASRLPRN